MSVFQKCKNLEQQKVAIRLVAPVSRLGCGVDTPNYLPQILDARTKHLLLDAVMMLDLPGQSALLYKDELEIVGGVPSQSLKVSLNHDLLRLVGRVVATMRKVLDPATLKKTQDAISSYYGFGSYVGKCISRNVFEVPYKCVASKHLKSMSLLETLAVASLVCWIKHHRAVGAVQEGHSETLATQRKIAQVANELSVNLFGWIPGFCDKNTTRDQKLVNYQKAQVAYNWVKDHRPVVRRCSTETFLSKQQQQVFSQLLGMIIRAYKVVDTLNIPAEELPAVVENFLRYTTQSWLEELAELSKSAASQKNKKSSKNKQAGMSSSPDAMLTTETSKATTSSEEAAAVTTVPLGHVPTLNEQISKEMGSLSPSTLMALAHNADSVKRSVLSVVDAQHDPVVKEVMSKMVALFLKDL